jgi:hypothetical protein
VYTYSAFATYWFLRVALLINDAALISGLLITTYVYGCLVVSPQGCKMVKFQNQKANFGGISWPLDIIQGHLNLHWYIFSILVCCTKKNVATLVS